MSQNEMDSLDFYNAISNPLSGLQDDTIQALMRLFHDVQAISETLKESTHDPN